MDNYNYDNMNSADANPNGLEFVGGKMEYTYEDKVIATIYPPEAEMCKSVTGMEYDEVLDLMLGQIDDDVWTSIDILFDRYNEPYDDETIPDVIAFAMQDFLAQWPSQE